MSATREIRFLRSRSTTSQQNVPSFESLPVGVVERGVAHAVNSTTGDLRFGKGYGPSRSVIVYGISLVRAISQSAQPD
jgi:hypothetical protein